MSAGEQSFPEALSYFPEISGRHGGLDRYLDVLRRANESTDIPIIGSLNGTTGDGWVGYATGLEQAGASAIELNIYYIPADLAETGRDVEERYLEVVRAVKAAVSIPVAVKLGPCFSAIGQMAREIVLAGADGLVLFNRFYQPDFDLDTLEVVPHLVLSSPDELRLPLRWVAIMYGRVAADLAITGGVHRPVDALKAMMAGANVAMMTSALLQNGIHHIGHVLAGMRDWMEENEYDSIQQMRGSMSQQNVAQPAAFERANYMKVLQSWRPDPTGQLL
jgi:dihydroorotate dehydrogenase (fumarate)